MERFRSGVTDAGFWAMFLTAVVLALALLVPQHARGEKAQKLDPNTCQQEGTCWIPAGGDPQPIDKKKKKEAKLAFNSGYASGQKFALPGTKKGNSVLLWMAIMEEWYGPWVLYYHGMKSYYALIRNIVFESRGNPYGATKSTVWIERGLTSVNDGFASRYDFDPCGDPRIAVWASAKNNENRRLKLHELVTSADPKEVQRWSWLSDVERMEAERWISAMGSVNSGVLMKLAWKANIHKIPEESDVTPWGRFIGRLRYWDNQGVLVAYKAGISVSPWRFGFRMGRGDNNEQVFCMISWRFSPGDVIKIPWPLGDQQYTVLEEDTMDSILAVFNEAAQASAEEVCAAQGPNTQACKQWRKYELTALDVVETNYTTNPTCMGFQGESFWDPAYAVPEMPTAKYGFPGEAAFGDRCVKKQTAWRHKLGKFLTTVIRRGDPEFVALQEQGYFPTEEEYAWFEENIGDWKIADSPLVAPLLDELD